MVYWTPYPWYIEPPTHGILNPVSKVFWTHYPSHIEPTAHCILTPYIWYINPTIHGISNSMSMVYRTPYPWCMEHPFMAYWTRNAWYIEPTIHDILAPLPIVPMEYRTRYHDWIQNTMTKIWPWCQNSIWYIEHGIDISGVQIDEHFTPELIHVIMFPTCIRINEY